MSYLIRVLLATFIESFATICVERGVYFYTKERMGFSEGMNLALALAFGVLYVVGSLGSHRLAERLGERKLAMLTVGGQLAGHLWLALYPTPLTIYLGTALLGGFNGLKWPIIESYVGAGRDAGNTSRTIGYFNFSWAGAVPVAMLAAGPLIRRWAPALYVLPAGINLATLGLLLTLPARPPHVPETHPHRPSASELQRMNHLLRSSRWLMLGGYSSLFVLAAIMPHIFQDGLGLTVQTSTALSGLLDVARVGTFVLFGLWAGWHGKRWPILGSMVILPLGFCLVLFGGSLGVVVGGELIFGTALGMIYYTALYYAMVVRNAAVDAGGVHEGLIGAGFAFGPAASLIGLGLASVLGGPTLGTLAGLAPLMAICTIFSAVTLRRHSHVPGPAEVLDADESCRL